MNITDLTPKQLHRAADLQEKIQSLQQELTGMLGGGAAEQTGAPRKTRRMSAAGRARIAAAQRARWAKQKGSKSTTPAAGKPRRKVSAAARKRLGQMAKARWAKAKAAGKNRL